MPQPPDAALLVAVDRGLLRTAPFRVPYPDFYAINALLLTAESWVDLPEKLVAVGISPKSFGRTLKGGGTDAGRAYLGIETQFSPTS